MLNRTARWGMPTAVLVAAGLTLTACGPNGTSASASVSVSAGASTRASSPASSPKPSAAPSTAPSGQAAANGGHSGTPKKAGVECTNQINYAGDPRSNAVINSIGAQTGYCPPVQKSSSSGSGAANAGDQATIIGTLDYVAPGKVSVTPRNGGSGRTVLVSNATTVLGAAAICGDPGGNVTIDANDYGTTKCTEAQLEKAAKTDAVTVRVTYDRKSDGAETVAERYHP